MLTDHSNFYHWGMWVARHPGTIMLGSLIFVGGFSAGLIKFQVETDPVALWCVIMHSHVRPLRQPRRPTHNVNHAPCYFPLPFPPLFPAPTFPAPPCPAPFPAPFSFSSALSPALLHLPLGPCRSAETSTTRLQKNYFDESFGPFYRTQQIILSTRDGSPIVDYANFVTLFELQGNVTEITVRNGSVTFFDLCFKPLLVNQNASDCVIQSVAGYWQNSRATLDFNFCDYASPNCSRVCDGPRNCTIVCETPCRNNPAAVIDHYDDCTSNPTSTGNLAMPDGCLPPFQDPIRPEVVIGGYVGTWGHNAMHWLGRVRLGSLGFGLGFGRGGCGARRVFVKACQREWSTQSLGPFSIFFSFCVCAFEHG